MSSLLHTLGPKGQDQDVIVTLNPADSKEFFRVLNEITKITGLWHCCIKNSKISQHIGMNLFLELDLKSMLGNDVDMAMILNKKEVKILKKMLGFEDLVIIHNKFNNCFIFENGNTKDEIQETNDADLFGPAPDFAEDEFIGEPVFISDSNTIRKYLARKKAGHLMVYDNQLEQFSPIGKQPYTFNTSSNSYLTNLHPNACLLSSNFLSITGRKDITLKLAENGHGTWLITNSLMSLGIKPTTYELLF